MERIDINKIKPNPDNPRFIRDDNYAKLVQSIKDFPEMLELRPVVVNKDMMVLGGNMRLRACIEAGLSEVSIIKADNLTPEQQKEFIVKDNIGFGEWDWNVLTSDWDTELLTDWGLEIPESGEDMTKGEVEFSEYLDEEHNYVVLYFDNRIDWLQAQTHFDLKSVNAKRTNGKPWSKGVGRVLNGADYLKEFTENK